MRERMQGPLRALRTPLGALGLSRAEALALATIGLVALALRIAWITLIPNTPFSDFLSDSNFAKQFASGVFPQGVTFQGAGYPLALALAYRLAGSSDIMVGKVENVILSMATIACCAYIFLRLTSRRWLAITATALVALLPTSPTPAHLAPRSSSPSAWRAPSRCCWRAGTGGCAIR